MDDDGRRFDTARFDPAKHGPRQSRKRPRVFGDRQVPRWVYRVILILALSVLAVLGWMNRDNLAPSAVLEWVQGRVVGMGVGDGYPHSITGTSVQPKNFLSYDKNVYFAGDTAFTVLNSTAKELASRQHSLSSPVLKLGGGRALLYNLGGKGCQVESLGRTVSKFNASGNVVAGSVARQGGYALLTEADGYCGELTTYTAGGRERFHYWFSDYYPTAVALSPDGSRAAVAGVNAKEGQIVSAVYLLDLNSGKAQEPLAVYPGNLLFDAAWDGDGAVAVFGDRASVLVDAGSGKKTEYGYGGRQLSAYCSNENGVVFGLSSYEGSSDSGLVVLNRAGGRVLSERLSGEIRSVSAFGVTAAALCGGRVYFYTALPAGPAGSADAGGDAKAVALRDEKSAYVLGVSEIRLINRS